jgi:hypothetical protein
MEKLPMGNFIQRVGWVEQRETQHGEVKLVRIAGFRLRLNPAYKWRIAFDIPDREQKTRRLFHPQAC